MRRSLVILAALLVIGAAQLPTAPVSAAQDRPIGINVVLKTDITPALLTDLGRFGNILDTIIELDAVHMRVRESAVPRIQALPYVEGANPDADRKGAPIDTVAATNFGAGLNTWNLDAVNVTDFGAGRTLTFDGAGVYVAVLDTGLLDSWRQYFPQERIAAQYARAFGGGGADVGYVSTQPNKWEHDQNSHGTHVTSTILGYSFNGTPFNGVAPLVTVVPVKVLNQNGSGWSSVIARGIVYAADLKETLGAPLVINMSLGGPGLDVLEKKAIDYAIAKGVVVVAAAGNEGEQGMGYPGAYPPVISVAAYGWIKEWVGGNSWWYSKNVADPINPGDFYITDFSSRELAGQELDVAGPGSWVVGPYQVNSGQLSYYFLGGTSMATPHVSGIAALMLQKNPALVQSDVEMFLKTSALPLAPGCADVINAGHVCWGADATGNGLVTANGALALVP